MTVRRRAHPAGILIGVFLAAAALAGCDSGPSGSSGSDAAHASGLAAGTGVADPGATPAFKAISLKGRGDKVAKFKTPEGAIAIATFTHSGISNFTVTSIDATGKTNELLVNEIGAYKGTVLFDDDVHSVAFRIEADGKWTATIKPFASARKWTLAKTLTGTGDDVVLVTGTVAGLASSTVKHVGKGNFAVVSYADDGRDLLVNEIGKYTGEILMPAGLVVIAVSADGKWSFTVPK
jgi:hypothetical protein